MLDLNRFIIVNGVFLFLLMTVAWYICIKIKNFSYVDFVWSGSFYLIGILLLFGATGWLLRKITFATMICFWSMRLASHLYGRITAHHPKEDVRYAHLRQDWRRNLNWKMFLFFQFQALTVVVLTIPFFIVMSNPSREFSPFEIGGMVLWVLSLIGESIADHQLDAFKKKHRTKQGVCDTGLWKYSRHPNYFFEWLIWISYFVFALGTPDGWKTVYAPALMLFFLTKMTGIPITEELSLKHRGGAYRDYQRRTSAFFPWFPKD